MLRNNSLALAVLAYTI